VVCELSVDEFAGGVPATPGSGFDGSVCPLGTPVVVTVGGGGAVVEFGFVAPGGLVEFGLPVCVVCADSNDATLNAKKKVKEENPARMLITRLTSLLFRDYTTFRP